MKRLFLVATVFIIISILLSIIWFHSGLIVAFGESEIPFYNPQFVLNFYSPVWISVGLGYFPGTTLPSLPFFTVAALLWHLHVPGVINQAIFFTFYNFIAMIGGYFLASSLFENKKFQNTFIGIIGGFFYLFNFVSLAIAYNRMQPPFTLFYLSLPFALTLFILGIKKKDLRYIMYFCLSLLPFVSEFGGFPFIELIWFFLSSYIFFVLVINWRRKKEVIFPLVFFASALLLWILCNLWWLPLSIQFALFTPHPAYSAKGNIGTFNILSDWQGNLSYLFRLMNQHFIEVMVPTWGRLYFNPIITVLTYAIPFFVFFPLLLKKRPRIVYYFLGLALGTLFFTKGSDGPFGQIFLFLFSYTTAFQVFRNPWEKIGLLLPIAYAPLIGYSLYLLWQYLAAQFNKKVAFSLLATILITCCGVLVYPFWNSSVFTSSQAPANNPKIGDFVQVPDYYNKANLYLEKDKSDNRILALPIGDEGITTNWPHPYNGVEYTNGLLNKPAISYTTIFPYLPDVTNQLNNTFLKEPNSIARVMYLLDAKYLMIRSDIDYKSRLIPNPDIFTNLANENNIDGIKYSETFGKLKFYTTISDPQKIFIASNIYAAPKAVMYTDIFTQTPFKNGDVIINTDESKAGDMFAKNHALITFFQPNLVIDYSNYPSLSLNDDEKTIPPYYRFLPNSPMYKILSIKEQLLRNFQLDEEDKMFFDMDLLSTRIGELQHVILSRDMVNFPFAARNYSNLLSLIQKRSQQEYPSEIKRNIDNFRYRMVGQEILLDNLINTVPEENINVVLRRLRGELNKVAKITGVESVYDNGQYKQEDTKRVVYQFDLNDAGKYKVVLKKENLEKYYFNTDGLWTIVVNNITFNVRPNDVNGWLEFGDFEMIQGINEIHLFPPQAKNLISDDTTNPIKLVANKNIKEQKRSFSIEPFNSTAKYRITYDYRLNMSGGALIKGESEFDDAPRSYDGKYYSDWVRQMQGTENKWVTESDVVTPYSTSNTLTMSFVADPANTCLRDNQYNAFASDRCTKDENFKKTYDQPTELEIKNIKVERVFLNTMLLIKENDTKFNNQQKPEISFKKNDSSKYTVSIKNTTSPFILVFNDTFYSAWEAIFSDTGKRISNDNHFLVDTYANAWYINRLGSYNITIQFSYQGLFIKGSMIAIPIILLIIFLTIIVIARRSKSK